MDAWSLFRSIGKAFGNFPDYLADSNMRYALFRAYGPDWQEKMRQAEEDHALATSLDRADLDNKRQDLATEKWTTELRKQQAMDAALENAVAMGGRTTGRYTPPMIGRPETQEYEDPGQLAFNESERLRKAKERWERYTDLRDLERKESSDVRETERKRKRDVAEIDIEKYKTTPEYLEERYEDRTDYERREAAEAKYLKPGKEPAEKESVTERVSRKLALANQVLAENPELDHPRTLDPETGEESEYYTQTGRPVPYTNWNAVPYHIQQEVEERLSGSRDIELGATDEAATPEPEKGGQTYRIPVSLKLKIDAGMELTPEELNLLRSLRR